MAVNQCGLPLHLHLHPGAAASTAVSEANLLADSLGVSPLYRQQEYVENLLKLVENI